MKMKYFSIAILLALVCSLGMSQGTPSTAPSTSYSDQQYLVDINGLPAITGKWFFVDPYVGNNLSSGRTKATALKNLDSAYSKCTDLAGDGICFLSPRSTSAMTTSYMTTPLVWAKNGITVYGVCAPTMEFGRARVSNLEVTTGSISVLSFTRGTGTQYDYITRTTGSFITNGFHAGQIIRVNTTGNGADASGTGRTITAVTATQLTLETLGTLVTETAANAGATVVENYQAYLINVSGDNNSFINMHFNNSETDALGIGGVIVSGDRNYFQNCFITGANGATAAIDAAGYSLQLLGAQDNTFKDCTIGSDLTDRANHASCEILFTVDAGKSCERDRFIGCEIQAFVSTGTAHGAIGSSDAASIRRDIIFKDCLFRADVTACATVFIGTTTTLGKIYMINSYTCNYTNWDDGSANIVRASAAAAVATGGGGLVVVGTER